MMIRIYEKLRLWLCLCGIEVKAVCVPVAARLIASIVMIGLTALTNARKWHRHECSWAIHDAVFTFRRKSHWQGANCKGKTFSAVQHRSGLNCNACTARIAKNQPPSLFIFLSFLSFQGNWLESGFISSRDRAKKKKKKNVNLYTFWFLSVFKLGPNNRKKTKSSFLSYQRI